MSDIIRGMGVQAGGDACLIGIDVGTTHIKVGCFASDGRLIATRGHPTPAYNGGYDGEALYGSVLSAVRSAWGEACSEGGAVAGIGIASMAETGLLIDHLTGAPRSALIGWFDPSAAPQAARIAAASDPLDRFCATGLHVSFKAGLAKLLWLRDHGADLRGALWLSVADYIAYRLTGAAATDPTLAARTCAYHIGQGAWDSPFLARLGLSPDMFPPVAASGRPVGLVDTADIPDLNGVPVTVAGHDHVVAALAVGATTPGVVYDSIGTAETLMGTLPARSLDEALYRGGLRYGPHVAPGRLYWMGSLSMAGGSVEWLRRILGDGGELSYESMAVLLDETPDEPTGILYYPHLAGSGFPKPDPTNRAAFIGLRQAHGRGHLLRAVLEGAAYEMETIRRAGERATGAPIRDIVAVGGGTRNRHWMQIKADVSGCCYTLSPEADATLRGAALLAGVAGGIYPDVDSVPPPEPGSSVQPDAARHEQYQALYEQGYQRLQEPLEGYYRESAQASGQT